MNIITSKVLFIILLIKYTKEKKMKFIHKSKSNVQYEECYSIDFLSHMSSVRKITTHTIDS
jgi:hypothetical protein